MHACLESGRNVIPLSNYLMGKGGSGMSWREEYPAGIDILYISPWGGNNGPKEKIKKGRKGKEGGGKRREKSEKWEEIGK